MYRFFLSPESIEKGKMVRITGCDSNHISHSLRLRCGDEITICTGDGWDYLVKLDTFTNEAIMGRIIKKEKNKNEPSIKITLAQAIPKKNKMDLIVQKNTELGLTRIIPLMTTRTIVKLNAKKSVERKKRWQRIAEEAAKQSQRGIIPVIEEIHNLNDLAQIAGQFDLILVPWEEERNNNLRCIWSKIEYKPNNVLIIIGPEGGLTREEIDLIEQFGGLSLTLGSRILRTETAGLVAITMILYESGNLGG